MAALINHVYDLIESAIKFNQQGSSSRGGFMKWKIRNGSMSEPFVIEIPDWYNNVEHISSGSYGRVYKAVDNRSPGRNIAIKKLIRPFDDGQAAARGLKELLYLKNLEHENIVKLTYAFTSDTSLEDFSHVYFTMELLSDDLRAIIKRRKIEKSNFLPDELKSVSYQLFKALRYLHSIDIIHRDLKPSNIGITPSGILKVFDFGLARNMSGDQCKFTSDVMSENYKAPELLLKWCESKSSYSTQVDLWGAGCVITELLTLNVLFVIPNIANYFRVITEVIGAPDEELCSKLSEEMRYHLGSPLLFHNKPPIGLKNKLKIDDETHVNLLDLIEKLLHLDPDRRICASDAMKHDYYQKSYDGIDDPMDVERLDCCDGVEDLPIEEVKRRMFEELTS